MAEVRLFIRWWSVDPGFSAQMLLFKANLMVGCIADDKLLISQMFR